MKHKIKSKIKNIFILIFLVTLVQAILIINTLNIDIFSTIETVEKLESLETNLATMFDDVKIIIFITILIQFILLVVAFVYLPIFLSNYLKGLKNALDDLSKGDYNADITKYVEKTEKEITDVFDSLENLIKNILQFDEHKREKIYEHHNRIKAILNLSETGFLVINHKGEIKYLNDIIAEHFPALAENVNLIESSFIAEIENSIKKQAMQIVKTKTKPETLKYFVPTLKRHISLQSKIIRDNNNNFKGAVMAIYNLDKKKTEKPKEPPSNDQ